MIALVRFQARGAASLALRNVLATVALAIVSLTFVPDAPAALGRVALAIAAADAVRTPGLAVVALGLLLGWQAVPALRLGLGGWLASLPISGRDQRRAMVLALLVPLVPVLQLYVLAVVAVPTLLGNRLGLPSVLAIPITVLAVAASAVPVRRGLLARPCALAAAILSIGGTWLALIGSAALLALWDAVAGPVALPSRGPERHRLADRWIPLLLSWRALRFRLLAPLVVSAILLGAAWLYRINNGLTVAEAAFGTRLATLASLAYGLAMLGDALVVRRRPWPWARSLPTTAVRRVLGDAIAISAPAVGTLWVAALIDWRSALVGLASLPTLALLAVEAQRRAGGKLLRVSGLVFASATLVIGVVSVWPASALLVLAFGPVALTLAARADRRLVVTGWEPLHHGAEGDSLSAGAR